MLNAIYTKYYYSFNCHFGTVLLRIFVFSTFKVHKDAANLFVGGDVVVVK